MSFTTTTTKKNCQCDIRDISNFVVAEAKKQIKGCISIVEVKLWNNNEILNKELQVLVVVLGFFLSALFLMFYFDLDFFQGSIRVEAQLRLNDRNEFKWIKLK